MPVDFWITFGSTLESLQGVSCVYGSFNTCLKHSILLLAEPEKVFGELVNCFAGVINTVSDA